jgi:xylulokinase
MSALTTIGLTGQMHGAVLLDKQGQVLRPAILWNDGRSHAQCTELMHAYPGIVASSGSLVMPGFTAPKLLWVRDHEPQIFAKIDKVLLPKDYIRYRLTGDFATDMSDASGTAWLDVANRQWDEQALAACHLTIKHMPTLYEGSEVTGQVSAQETKHLSLPANINVVAGAADNPAGALAMGVYQSGQGMLSLGTSGVYFAVTSGFASNPDKATHAFCHALPKGWYHMAVMLSAASCLSWWKSASKANSESELLAEVEQEKPTQIPIFLPHLSGERTPHNDPYAAGCFIGLHHNTTRAAMTQAVLEGVAMGLAEGQLALQESGAVLKTVSVVGGGSKSQYWGQILANILNRPLQYHMDAEVGPALGAARLALLSAHPHRLADIMAAPLVISLIQPQPEKIQYYQDRLAQFQQLYRCLKPCFVR